MERYVFVDPLKFGKELWPSITFTRHQRDIIYSVVENDETIVVAGNMLGKDFVSAFIVLWFFLSRSPCRIVTTSADYSQLESVLWGELRRFIQTSRLPLEHTNGGPLVVNHMHLRKFIKVDDGTPMTYDELRRFDRKVTNPMPGYGRLHRGRELHRPKIGKQICGLSYCIGRVAAKGEGLLGHHIAETGDGVPRTLFLADEASGVDDLSYERATTWAKRILVIGNAYECNNFFRRAIKEGDKLAHDQSK